MVTPLCGLFLTCFESTRQERTPRPFGLPPRKPGYVVVTSRTSKSRGVRSKPIAGRVRTNPPAGGSGPFRPCNFACRHFWHCPQSQLFRLKKPRAAEPPEGSRPRMDLICPEILSIRRHFFRFNRLRILTGLDWIGIDFSRYSATKQASQVTSCLFSKGRAFGIVTVFWQYVWTWHPKDTHSKCLNFIPVVYLRLSRYSKCVSQHCKYRKFSVDSRKYSKRLSLACLEGWESSW